MMVDECHGCKQPKSPLWTDKLYKHALCNVCFVERREAAARALHTEWFLVNIPFEQMSENERLMAGLRTQDEYDKAKERPTEEE